METIIIKDEFKNDYTTRIAGEKLRIRIIKAKTQVTLDFMDLKIASASFFDEGIAKLSEEGWNSKDLNHNIRFLNIFKKDLELLKSVCSTRGIEVKI